MPVISQAEKLTTVIVTVDAVPEALPDMEKHAQFGIESFGRFKGFVAGALHRSTDGGRLVQYLQWASEEDYQAAIGDPYWGEVASARKFIAHLEAGTARIDVRIYTVVRSSQSAT